MCLSVTFNEVIAYSKGEFKVVIVPIKHYGYDRIVGVLEGYCFNFSSPLTATDSLGTDIYILAKMTYIIVGIVDIDFSGLRIHHNRGVAEVANVVGASLFVKE